MYCLKILLILLLLFLSQYFSTLFPGWSLLKDNTECAGSEIVKGRKSTVDECASACKEVASLFAFGKNDRCYDGGSTCKCLCETAASNDGSCKEVDSDNYRLYQYEGNLIIKQKLNKE